jgi:hypothetical protein
MRFNYRDYLSFMFVFGIGADADVFFIQLKVPRTCRMRVEILTRLGMWGNFAAGRPRIDCNS